MYLYSSRYSRNNHNSLTRMACIIIALALCALAAIPLASAFADAIPMVSRSANESGMVRVRLDSFGSPGTYSLTVSGAYRAGSVAVPSGTTASVRASGGSFTLSVNGSSHNMGSSFWMTRQDRSSSVKIAQAVAPANQYPGDIRFTYQNGTAYVICSVFIEDYLPGVVGYEMSDSFPLEALKAQAISARTYAMRKAAVSSGNYYDLRDTTADQVYRGTPSGKGNVKSAVDATTGMTLMYGNEYCQVYYSSSNGGQTETNSHAWGGSALPYYQMQDDPYDLANPSSTARKGTVYASFSNNNSAVQSLISAAVGSGSIQTIQSIELTSPKYDAPSRLYTQARVSVRMADGSAGGGTVQLFGGLDKALGLNTSGAKNELFYVNAASEGFQITARRYGHGVGLSQYGAQQMASTGYDFLSILGFYFKGASLVKHSYTASYSSDGTSSSVEPIAVPEAPAATPGASMPSGQVSARVVLDDPSSRLNMRRDPNESSVVVAKVPSGSVIRVEGASASGWVRATYEGVTGYVVAKYVQTVTPDAIQLPSPIAQPPVTGTATARVAATGGTGTLNLRTSPSLNAEVITRIPANAEVTLSDQDASSNAEWVRVAYRGMTGYVMKQYLSIGGQYSQQPVASNDQNSAPPSGVIVPELKAPDAVQPQQNLSQMLGMGRVSVEKANGHLNLRQDPSTSSPVLVMVNQGEQVEVYALGAEWAEIRYQGVYGYASSKYINMSGGAASAPPVAVLTVSAGSAASLSSGTAWVVTESGEGNLFLRAKASASSAARARVPHGSALAVLSTEGDWTRVKYSGQTGYVKSSYLKASAPASAAVAAQTQAATPVVSAALASKAVNSAKVKLSSGGSSLNMRDSASASAQTIAKIPNGDTADILGYVRGGEWALARYGSHVGFLSMGYLKLSYPVAEVRLNAGETVSVRRSAAADGAFIMSVSSGDYLTVLERGSEWTKVCADGGVTGYVMSSVLK